MSRGHLAKRRGAHGQRLALAGGVLALTSASVFLAAPAVQAQGPQMPDPKSMSGMARVDAGLAPGEVTVRCLLGSFAEPAIGVTVVLAVQVAPGQVERFEATSVEAGRATFTGLAPYIGKTAVASAIIGGAEVRSGPIPLASQGGSRLLLVKGASAPSPGMTPAAMPGQGSGQVSGPRPQTGGGPHGTGGAGGGAADLPPFGIAFELEGRPVGTLVVGVLDMRPEGNSPAEKIQPFADHAVRVYAVKQDGARRLLLEKTTDKEGRASFSDVTHEDDELIVAETEIEGEAEPLRSQPFDARAGAKAIVLLPAALAQELNAQQQAARQQQAAQQQNPAPKQRRPMPPVRRDATLAAESVSVTVVDKDDKPVAGAKAQVVRIDAARDERRFEGDTTQLGVAVIDVTETKKDALYYAEVIYDDAPYRSHLFDLPLTGGAAVSLRVFERTEDSSKVRSAVHFELNSLENDKARVLVAYEVMVDGDKAYWPRGGMQLWGPEGVTIAKPLPEAEDYLEEVEGAPYAKLTGPLPPGVPLKLSMAFIAKHDGSLDVDWKSPFPLVGARVAVEGEIGVTRGAEPGDGQAIDHGGPEKIILHELPIGTATPSVCSTLQAADPELHCPKVLGQSAVHDLSFSVDGLTRRPPYGRWIAMGVGSLILLATGLAMALRPRESRVQALLRRRTELMERFKSAEAQADAALRERLLRALDDVYRKLDALGALPTV